LRNADLVCQGSLGGEIEVPTSGKGRLRSRKAPSRARPSASKARASKACVPASRATCSATAVETPVKLTEKQKELLREFENPPLRAAPSTARRPRPGATR
jgi:molecular chaperone DnaJ